MSWFYHDVLVEQIPEGMIGFVYCITNLTNDRKYIGKKLFYFAKTKQVKGKKKKYQAESDWKEYYGSSEDVQADVATLGADKFKREILHFVKTKGTLSYLELREQIDRRVLENPTLYYNGIIQCKIHRTHVKLTT